MNALTVRAALDRDPAVRAWHDDRVNHGRHVVYGGGEYDSHLLVPVQVI